MPLGTEVGLGPGHIVLHGELGTQLALPLKGHSPQFSAHVSCGQTAGWIKMPLGGKVALDPGITVLDGNPAALPHRGTACPTFGLCLLRPNGWMDQDATWYEDRRFPRSHCIRFFVRSRLRDASS